MAAASAPDRSLYAALGLPPDAGADDVRRAYRAAAAAVHPDKVGDAALRPAAAAAFQRVQEAYEVLSDPAKRDVYDVYGLEGLRSGLEVGDPLKSREQLKKEWAAFRARAARAESEARLNFRGAYAFRFDALDATAAVLDGIARRDARAAVSGLKERPPALVGATMNSGVDVPFESQHWWGPLASAGDAAHLGGAVQVRRRRLAVADPERPGRQRLVEAGIGGGSFVAGYRRSFADYSGLDFQASVGLRSLVSATHSVQLSPAARASLAATWQPGAGLGCQLVTTRQLSQRWAGEYAWVVGPRAAAGMSLSLTRRGDRSVAVLRLDVGAAATGLALRLGRDVGPAGDGGDGAPRLHARAGVKASLQAGLEGDVGLTRRLGDDSAVGVSVGVGVATGVVLRARVNRAGHNFEFPVMMAGAPDARAAALALALPPALVLAVARLVVAPARALLGGAAAASARAAAAAAVAAAAEAAAAAAAVMAPVAARRTRAEAAAGGLVVALALYGDEAAVGAAARARLLRLAAAAGGGGSAAAGAAAAPPPPPPRLRAHPLPTDAPPAAAAPEGEAAPGAAAAAAAAPPAGGEAAPEPPADVGAAVLDVTTAVRYMVSKGAAVFHPGYAKAGLMGFADPAPGAPKALVVYFTFKGRPMRAALGDAEGGALPAAGGGVADAAEAAAVAAAAAAAAGEGGGGGGGARL